MTETIDTAPARVLVQVREGVPNVLADFDLPIYETQPLDPNDPGTIEGAKVIHRIDRRDLIGGLATAQRKLIADIREEFGIDADDEHWFRGLFEWVMSE